MTAFALPAPGEFRLHEPGRKGPVDYTKYGKFSGIGTADYKYTITDEPGLAKAVGPGIHPNRSLFKDPEYQRLKGQGRLEGSHWDFINNKNHELNFYKWATSTADGGTKQYYTAMMLEELGMWAEAIKAYHAVAVHFPKTAGWTYWETPWYLGPSALDRAEILCRRHPEAGLELKGGRIQVVNGFDVDVKNDVFLCDPGELVRSSGRRRARQSLAGLKGEKVLGGSQTKLVQYENGHWQMLVNGRAVTVKAVAYSPNPVGKSPDRKTLVAHRDWQDQDTNDNGVHDSFFESWVDENRNNKQDPEEAAVGDVALLAKAGANAIRAYHHVFNKPLLRRLHEEYGLWVLVGDVLGGYAIDSGADWKEGTRYSNPKQRAAILKKVEEMVLENKDEPYVLLWVLGNENVYGAGNDSDKDPEAFFTLVEEAARLIHRLDPSRPVAIANGDLKYLDLLVKFAPSVDIIGANAYRGEFGFGRSFFRDVRETAGKPVLVTEFGVSAYGDGFSQKEAAEYQARYIRNNWEDLEFHMAGRGEGNAIGGVLFEWTDEWWKANSDLPERVQKQRPVWYARRAAIYKDLQPENHDTVPQFGAPFLDGWSYEEWFGVFGQGDGRRSPFLREPRPAYQVLQEIWAGRKQ